ncbi:MAG: hypothetical protein NT062_28190, partial [Proteobacteria bacterium]|nr:hypothetical protein [Pseudomonadota bacterium]
DELPPVTGTLVGIPGPIALLGPCVVVAREPLEVVAARLASRVGGAILVGVAPVADVVVEARAYGAVAMTRDPDLSATLEPRIIVVDDEAAAELLDLPAL